MHLHSLLSHSLQVLIPLAFALTLQLYLYPVFRGCTFPSTDGSFRTSFQQTLTQHYPFDTIFDASETTSLAPFRLLVLADPQLEGDSSLPPPEEALLPRLKKHVEVVREANSTALVSVLLEELKTVFVEDLPQSLFALRKQIDLFGNDYYLAHIFRTLNWWTRPTHVTVLGDLIGSQWVSDDEFDWRGWRYWNRVLAGSERVEDEVTTLAEGEQDHVFSLDDSSWKSRIINIAGNHDIGYAGDVTQNRMNRFERVFGKANWDVKFEYPHNANSSDQTHTTPSLHMVVLNSLVLDTPAMSEDIQTQTFEYLNGVIANRLRPVEDPASFTLLLTHLPLFKKEGVCVDSYYFDFWDDDDCSGNCRPHGLKEQNHLSMHASQPGILEGLFGMKGDLSVPASGRGRNGLILTGHDHEGCDTWHFIPTNETYNSELDEERERSTRWDSVKWRDAESMSSHTGLREVTLRSMMGDFGGNAGLLSAWYDFSAGEWKYNIQMCGFGVQHIWWAVHVVDLITVLATILYLSTLLLQQLNFTAAVKEIPVIPKGKRS